MHKISPPMHFVPSLPERRLFTNFHRQLFCTIDKWIELTMEDIRKLEDKTQQELDKQRKVGSVRGTKPI